MTFRCVAVNSSDTGTNKIHHTAQFVATLATEQEEHPIHLSISWSGENSNLNFVPGHEYNLQVT